MSKPGNAPKAGDLVSSYTKHYYIGSERVSSTLGTVRDLGLFLEPLIGMFPNIRPLADETVQEANTGLTNTYTAMEQGLNLNAPVIEGTIKEFKHKPDTYDVYWHHSDHLD